MPMRMPEQAPSSGLLITPLRKSLRKLSGCYALLMSLLGALLLALFSTGAYAQSHISVAQHTTNPETSYSSGAQPNRVLAARIALQQCQQANPPVAASPGTTDACELVVMDGEQITTAAQLRPQHEAATPLYLWRFRSDSRNDSATVYVGGTVHILKQTLYPLPEQYQQAYDASQNLVFEVDLSRYAPAQVQNKTMQYAQLSEGSLRQSLPTETYQALVDAGLLYGMPVGQMQNFKPMLAFQQLGVLGMFALGYDPAFGVDHYFGQLGERDAEHILQLETLEQQLSLLFNQPLDVQVAVLEQALEELDSLETTTSALVRAYFHGDDATLFALMDEQAGDHPLTKAFNAQLIDQRNRNMAKKIKGYLDTNESYFVLVGAAHLVGPTSIIALLQRAGFKGTRLYSNQPISAQR